MPKFSSKYKIALQGDESATSGQLKTGIMNQSLS